MNNSSKYLIETDISKYGDSLLNILLFDRTTQQNIIWGTSDYEHFGCAYNAQFQITPNLITGENKNIIQSRIHKDKNAQIRRTNKKAEVFTPSWICNKQNNLIDRMWFGKDVFNHEANKGWETITERIIFSNKTGKTWKDYVKNTRLEITCGEAPYLVSRYDTVSGKIIPVSDRIGFLDRKLRVVSENTIIKDHWLIWAEIAFQSIYGYEYQGDNVFIARKNLLYTFIDYHINKFGKEPDINQIYKIAYIISWNVWQMDGLTLSCIPNSMFRSDEKIPCHIMDWETNKQIEFKSFVKGC